MRTIKEHELLEVAAGMSPRHTMTFIGMMAAKGTMEAFFYKLGEKVVDASGFDEIAFGDCPSDVILENPSYAPYILAGAALVGIGFAVGYAASWSQRS